VDKLNPENLIENWAEAIGLTIIQITEYSFNDYDEIPEFTVIYFSDGRFAIQRDQSYYTTTCGLVCKRDFDRHMSEVRRLNPSEITTFNKDVR
jgi:hypothetical protein